MGQTYFAYVSRLADMMYGVATMLVNRGNGRKNKVLCREHALTQRATIFW